MMYEVGDEEVETGLSRLLERVEAGEEVVITRSGKPVARLLPPLAAPDVPSAQEAAEAIRSMSRGASLGGLSIKDLMNEGRR